MSRKPSNRTRLSQKALVGISIGVFAIALAGAAWWSALRMAAG